MSHTFDRAAPTTSKLKPPAAIMQSSRIPTVSGPSGTAPKAYMMGTATSRSRSRRGSSSSEREDRGSMDQARTTTARDRSQPRSSSRPPTSRSVSLSRSKTPSNNPAVPAKQPKNESGSSMSMLRFGRPTQTEDKSRKLLRRKAPSIEQYSKSTKPQPSSSVPVPRRPSVESTQGDRMTTPERPFAGSYGGSGSASHPPQSRQPTRQPTTTSMSPQHTSNVAMGSQNSSIPKEFRSLMTAPPSNSRNLLPHPTPPALVAASPSTMYSESPGPWSSRNSTPTSISSYSPGILQPTKVSSRLRQPSPSLSGGSAQHQPSRHLSPYDTSGISSTSALLSGSPQRSARNASYRPQIIDNQPTESQLKLASLSLAPPTGRNPETSSAAKSKSSAGTLANRSESKRQERPAGTSGDSKASDEQRSENTSRLRTPGAVPRPLRPTRRGTDELSLDSSPVIHSSLPTSRIPGHRRQTSSELRNLSRPNVTRPANVSSESLQSTSSRLPHRNASPNVAYPQDRHAKSTPPVDTKGVEPQRKPTPPVASRRFGMFTRKSKTVPEVTASRTDKESRKGPAAGTGHEGYGRYAARGRRPSVGSNTSRARSTSTSASASQSSIVSRAHPGMDDFFRDRLEPIIISGGGMEGAELTRTESGQSLGTVSLASTTRSEPYAAYPAGGYSSDSLASFGGHLVQSPESYGQSGARSLLGVHEEPKRQKKAVLTKRRSFRKSLVFGGGKESSQQQGSQGGVTFRSPWLGSTNTSATSLSRLDSNQSDSNEGQTAKVVKEAKSEKPSKWNFFQRSRHIHRKPSQTDLRSAAMPEVPVAVKKIPAPKQKPHYAMLDGEQIDSDSLEDLLRRIDESPPTEAEDSGLNPVGLGLKRHHGQSVLLPEAPPALLGFAFDKPPSSPKVFLNKDMPGDERDPKSPEDPPRKPRVIRLTSVGRIPKVVPREDRQPNPAVPSFSRPFSRAEASSLTATADDQTYLSPSAPSTGPPAGAPFWPAPVPNAPSDVVNPLPGQEFIAFSPRKGSDESGSSLSDSRKSLSAVTAVIPPPGAMLTGDEVWDEYDEFLDHVTSPRIGADLVDPSRRNPFLLATEASKALQEGLNEEANRDSIMTVPSTCSGVTSIASTPLSAQPSSVHLRRSMVFNALHTSLALSTPRSFSEFQQNAGEGSRYSGKLTAQASSSSLRTQRPLPVPVEQPTAKAPTNRKRNTMLLELAERNRYGALAQANLRSGSLMTSRWLSFGRVLFSPAQNHVQSQDQSRILVIDGLGNDDWSFYCALTYSMATVYNLTASQSFSASSNPAAWAPPPNHRSVYRANLESPFPFPRGFFTAVILRFPAACAEAELRSTVSECKRVLRAGGYLELSVLDLDMVNMGSRTRKAVRILKERMCTADPTISLKPASDNIQRLLGKRGFENLNRCMVVVPVAGSIMASSDTSSSGRSMGHGSSSSVPSNTWTEKGSSHHREPSDSADVSLGELLADSSPSASNDESIAKMVARVGRWWYTRCYESCVLSDGNLDDSMWSDRRVLRECQRRGTGLKLLIAYAQKPTELPRRTVSV